MRPWMMRPLRYMPLAVLLSIAAAWPAACTGEATIETGEEPPCEVDFDCYDTDKGHYYPGTVCLENKCRCPLWEEGYQQCCPYWEPADNCHYNCYPEDQCAGYDGGVPASSASASSGAAASSGDAAPVQGQCDVDKPCSLPEGADALCIDLACVEGTCKVTIKTGPLPSQVRGDCKRRDCDVAGTIVDVDDPSDVYNDGRECSYDVCEGGVNAAWLLPDGFPCKDGGYCHSDRCVECIDDDSCMKKGMICVNYKCVPSDCQDKVNGIADPPLESGIDCGGQCFPCFNPDTCNVASDCFHGVCEGGVCALPTQSDGVTNDGETGVDCGGDMKNPRCPDGQGCAVPEDCQSGVCWAGKCEAPTCLDSLANGDELGVDCGGKCKPCP